MPDLLLQLLHVLILPLWVIGPLCILQRPAGHSETYAPPDDLVNPPRRPDSKGYIPCRTIDSVPPRKTRCLLTSAGG